MTNTNIPPEFFVDTAAQDGTITDGHAPVGDERAGTEGVRDDGMDADGIDITATDGPNLESGNDLDTGAGGANRNP